MENWIVYYDKNYTALPWPFEGGWEQVVQGSTPLLSACENFGIVSPTDDSSEIPAVPADLPRGVPNGRYQFAVYHDVEYLYVLLDVTEAERVFTTEMFERQVQVPPGCTGFSALMLLSADEQILYRFDHQKGSKATVRVSAASHGPRRRELPTLPSDWQYFVHSRENAERLGWRIARHELREVLDGSRLRLSVSRASYLSHEYVAWGGGAIWGPRPDEFGTVQLITEPQTSPWPICRRLDLQYYPQRETGRFRLYWEDLYRADEEFANKSEPMRSIPPQICSLRINGREQLLQLDNEILSEETSLADGHNCIEIATSGARAWRFFLEIRSGNSITPCPYPVQAEVSRDQIHTRLREEITQDYKKYRERIRNGDPICMRGWPMYMASSAGRVHAWLENDERLLEILRGTADEALVLQREDGTFSGFHLNSVRQVKTDPPRWAGGAYDSGQAGELWAVAAWQLGDEKYFEASRKLLHAYEQYRIEFNHNYAAFALFHLAAHYRLTRDPLALEHGLYYARHLAGNNILPLGFQAGHNFYTIYGFITLRGLANFCQVLPHSEPYREVLKELCVRMTNQLIARLQPDGSFDSRDRYFLGERRWISALFSVALLLDGEPRENLDRVLRFMLSAPPETPGFSLMESEVARYLACRKLLQQSQPVDLLELV